MMALEFSSCQEEATSGSPVCIVDISPCQVPAAPHEPPPQPGIKAIAVMMVVKVPTSIIITKLQS